MNKLTVFYSLVFIHCFQSERSLVSYALNDTQLSTIPLDEFAVERDTETQFQEPPVAGPGRQDQG